MGGMRLGNGKTRGQKRLEIEISHDFHSLMENSKELTEDWDFLGEPVHPFMSCIERFGVESRIERNLDEERSELKKNQ
jgi:hypothetical protein